MPHLGYASAQSHSAGWWEVGLAVGISIQLMPHKGGYGTTTCAMLRVRFKKALLSDAVLAGHAPSSVTCQSHYGA